MWTIKGRNRIHILRFFPYKSPTQNGISEEIIEYLYSEVFSSSPSCWNPGSRAKSLSEWNQRSPVTRLWILFESQIRLNEDFYLKTKKKINSCTVRHKRRCPRNGDRFNWQLPASGIVNNAATALMADLFSSSCFSYSCLTELAFTFIVQVFLSGSTSPSNPKHHINKM